MGPTLPPEPRTEARAQVLSGVLRTVGKQDGVDYLLRAIGVCRGNFASDTLFVIIGDGPSQPAMLEMAHDLGINDCVCFTGRVPDVQLRSYLATADLCVDPDPWNEFTNASTMNKIIDYMSLGKPIIAFDLLEHRRSALDAAHYVEQNDISKFAASIRELLEDEQRREQMSKFARDRFQDELAWEVSEEHLVRAYNDLFNEPDFTALASYRRQALRKSG